MFGSSFGRANAYARIGVETGVSTADPHTLILMLYDGAVMAVTAAGVAMDNKQIPVKGEKISKAIEIITNGLKVSLDMNAGGELAERLAALYDYMADRLLYANLHNNRAALDEVNGLLCSLRDTWREISPGKTAAATAASA
ncbi:MULTISPECIES: flagellar export chaperone FliS [Thauera]|uniref:Flagellar secretion chaperone FliS n=1 Tax=Thauera propionica TaxID=2019431 RepID=A0A235EWC3_9RHOO|nr:MULTISPECIES: flagellar export chaperone FliS [Thauera]ENO74888.1 flagellar protein FliS [Thauera sp. 63]OYD53352.1 flagellar export chaperone FliS [Thauera propionica]